MTSTDAVRSSRNPTVQSMPSAPQARHGRYRSELSEHELVTGVRGVAAHARPSDPALCSQHQFDTARVGAGHPELPTAATIVRRLRTSWPALLDVIFDPDRDEYRFLAMRDRDTRERALTLEDAAAAIRHSAGVRGVAAGEELSRAEHDAVMGPPRDRASGRRDAADADWLYPTAQMIDSSVGWENALTAAGLRRARGGGVARGLPLVRRPGALPARPRLPRRLQHRGGVGSSGRGLRSGGAITPRRRSRPCESEGANRADGLHQASSRPVCAPHCPRSARPKTLNARPAAPPDHRGSGVTPRSKPACGSPSVAPTNRASGSDSGSCEISPRKTPTSRDGPSLTSTHAPPAAPAAGGSERP